MADNLDKLSDAELDAKLLELDNLNNMSDDELTKMARGLNPNIEGAEPTAIQKGLNSLLKASDAVSGGIRTAAFKGIEELTGKDIVDEERALKAASTLTGDAQFQTGSELLKKSGVPKLGQVSDLLPGLFSKTGEGLALERGGLFDITGRGALGTAVDTVADLPTLFVGKGLRAAAAGTKGVAKLLNIPLKSAAVLSSGTPTNAVKAIADTSYLTSIKKFVDLGLKKGKKNTEEVFRRYGISGTSDNIESQLLKAESDLLAKKNAAVQSATDAGVVFDAHDVLTDLQTFMEDQGKRMTEEQRDGIFRRVENQILDPSSNPRYIRRSQLEKEVARIESGASDFLDETLPDLGPLDDEIKKISKELHLVTPQQLDELKMFASDELNDSVRDELKFGKGIGNKVAIKLESLMREALEKTVEQNEGKAAAKVFRKNQQDLGTFLSTNRAIRAIKDPSFKLPTKLEMALAPINPQVAASFYASGLLSEAVRSQAGPAGLGVSKLIEGGGLPLRQLSRQGVKELLRE